MDRIKVFRKFSQDIGETDLTKTFSKFYDARNQVLSHDQVDFRENLIGIVIDNENRQCIDIVPLTIRTRYLYEQNQKLLLRMIRVVQRYVDEQIKTLEERFINDYNSGKITKDLKEVHTSIPSQTAW